MGRGRRRIRQVKEQGHPPLTAEQEAEAERVAELIAQVEREEREVAA